MAVKSSILVCLIRDIHVVAEALLERRDVEIVTFFEQASILLERRGVPHMRLDSVVTPGLQEQAMDEAVARIRGVEATLQGALAAAWPDYSHERRAALQAEVSNAIRRDFAEEVVTIGALRRLSCEKDLRLVIVPEDISRDTRTVVEAARRLRIPSLHLLHGYMCGTTNCHNMINADCVAAYSAMAKAMYVSYGARPENVFVTGNPPWDVYAGPPLPRTREQFCAGNGLDPARPVVEYSLTAAHRFSAVSTLHPRFHLQTAEAVIKAFAALAPRHRDWQFALRPHPYEPETHAELLAMAAAAGVPVCLDLQPPYDCAASVDLLLVTHSNLGAEAVLAGKPVINVAIDAVGGPVFNEGVGQLMLEEDAVLWARTEEEIAPAIEAAMLDEQIRNQLRARRPWTIAHFNHANDGRACERFCDAAFKVMDHPERYLRPVCRYAEYERALAAATPHAAPAVAVVGTAAEAVKNSLLAAGHGGRIDAARHVDTADIAADALVLSDPLDTACGAEALLRCATVRFSDKTVLIAAFRNAETAEATRTRADGNWAPPRPGGDPPSDVHGYTRASLEALLHRSGWEPTDVINCGAAETHGWVVVARRIGSVPGEFGLERKRRRMEAESINAEGEALFERGRTLAAIDKFAAAIDRFNADARYFNNLATGFYAAGDAETAWKHLLEALHIDPTHPVARENLRTVGTALGRDEEAEQILSLWGN